MSTQSEIREVHQEMEKELRRYPSGALGPPQLEQLYALAARMQRLVADEAATLAADADMRALHLHAQTLDIAYNALPI